MAIYDAIKNFHTQFEFEPAIENGGKWKKFDRFIVAGMGGSHWAADLLKVWNPYCDVLIHKNYGLPALSDEELHNRLIIISSYSGNTEEAIDAYENAMKNGLAMAVVSVGGKLLELAENDGVPHVRMPDIGIQPRSALGFSFKSILKLLGEEDALQEIRTLAEDLRPIEFEAEGRQLAERLQDFVPVIYASEPNAPIAANWKIKFNETGKIPAFCNSIPELNHNEMTGFDVQNTTKALSRSFFFLFLRDYSDDPRILRRMEVLEGLYRDRGLPVKMIPLEGKTVFHKMFSSLVLADWAAYYIAEQYGVEAEQVPMVEEFKKLIA